MIVVVFIYQHIQTNDKIIKILNDIHNSVVDKMMRDEDFKQMLIFKYKNIARKLTRNVGIYILRNNIKTRFETIKEEIHQNVNAELNDFRYLMESKTDYNTFIKVYNHLSKELILTTDNVIEIMKELKKEHDYSDEKNTMRLVLLEIDNLETRLVSFVQEL